MAAGAQADPDAIGNLAGAIEDSLLNDELFKREGQWHHALRDLHADAVKQYQPGTGILDVARGGYQFAGVLPGYCKDKSYFPDAVELKAVVDAQLNFLYTSVTPSATTGPFNSKHPVEGLHSLMTGMARILREVARHYVDHEDAQAYTELAPLAEALGTPLPTVPTPVPAPVPPPVKKP